MTKRSLNHALYRLNDYLTQVDTGKSTVHILCGETKALILSCLRYAEYFSTRWYVSDENQIGAFSSTELDAIENIQDVAKEQIIMGCDTEELVGALTAIADQMEVSNCCQIGTSGGWVTVDDDEYRGSVPPLDPPVLPDASIT